LTAADKLARWENLLLWAEFALAGAKLDTNEERRAYRVAKGERAVAQAKARLAYWQSRIDMASGRAVRPVAARSTLEATARQRGRAE
jgi:hypothetical protein